MNVARRISMLLLGAVLIGGLLRVAAEDKACDASEDPTSLQVGIPSLPVDQDQLLITTPVGSGQRFDLRTAGIVEVEEDECAARRKGASFDLPTAQLSGRTPSAFFVASVSGSPFVGHVPLMVTADPLHVRFQVFRI